MNSVSPSFLVLASIAGLLSMATLADQAKHRIRLGNSAWSRGELDVAAQEFRAAEETTDDPGLVAFNRAAVEFVRGKYREAEILYLRALDDQWIPQPRQAHALYNRGVCLVARARDTEELTTLRTAIDCFEQCLRSSACAGQLRENTQHNLELAKMLWIERRKQSSQRTKPDELPREKQVIPLNRKSPEKEIEPNPSETVHPTMAPGSESTTPTPAGTKPGLTPIEISQSMPGIGTLPVLRDHDVMQHLGPEDTRAYLLRIMNRLTQERRAGNRLKAGPERPNVRDW